MEGVHMTYQEILEGITQHRANPLIDTSDKDWSDMAKVTDVKRKIDEIEWALQALAERGKDIEQQLAEQTSTLARANQSIIDQMLMHQQHDP
jgi:hypothetical protein